MKTITLDSDIELPAVGFGVFQTHPDETRDASQAALACGYRHIDTAVAYANERQVGEAVGSSELDRSEVLLETKIWASDYGYGETLHAFEKSARKLGVEQIDLLILHQALPSAFDRTLEAYRALETFARRRQRPLHRSQQLHGGAPREGRRQQRGGAGGQPDRMSPLLRAANGAGLRLRPRDRHAGVVADRRHNLLLRRQSLQHPR